MQGRVSLADLAGTPQKCTHLCPIGSLQWGSSTVRLYRVPVKSKRDNVYKAVLCKVLPIYKKKKKGGLKTSMMDSEKKSDH